MEIFKPITTNNGWTTGINIFFARNKYLQTQYKKCPQTIKAAEDVPEWSCLNKIWFASFSKFSWSTLSSLVRNLYKYWK